MKDLPGSALDVQVAGLLERVQRATDQRCHQLRTEAEQQARQILHSARTEARQNVGKAVAEARARLDQGLRQAEAHAELESRQRAQREMQTLLEYMWELIVPKLNTLWEDTAHRRAWIESSFTEAGALLSGRTWRIEHGISWTPDERRELGQLAQRKGAHAVEWIEDPNITAGLRIRTDGVCLSTTVSGLLSRREAIESAFLAAYGVIP